MTQNNLRTQMAAIATNFSKNGMTAKYDTNRQVFDIFENGKNIYSLNTISSVIKTLDCELTAAQVLEQAKTIGNEE